MKPVTAEDAARKARAARGAATLLREAAERVLGADRVPERHVLPSTLRERVLTAYLAANRAATAFEAYACACEKRESQEKSNH